MIRTLLVANRGEIAARIIRTAREMGIRTIAVHAEDDRRALFTDLADHAVALPGEGPRETYLSAGALIGAARSAGADAIHPGYGFLAESAAFALAVRDAGIVFVGPSPETMKLVGPKVSSKAIADAAGVPTLPWRDARGLRGGPLREAGRTIGYPLLVKASAGGGGKGMRVVAKEGDLEESVAAAGAEAAAAFGDGSVFLEKWIAEPRHVEVQILGDRAGRIVAFPERECSIQRRHQKILEETPAPALDAALRARLAAAAAAIGREARYEGAGTVEFLLDPAEGAFYFLEVNARLQVEHPITEMITGLDLVAWQLRIASGEELPFPAEGPAARGHAIECRLLAEDAARGFLPAAGEILRFEPPAGPGVRVDSGVREGEKVSLRYDSLIAKIAVHAEDRPAAVARMARALGSTTLLGIPSNLDFLSSLVAHEAFRRGETTTAFLERHGAALAAPPPLGDREIAAIGLFELLRPGVAAGGSAARDGDAGARDPWSLVRDFRCGG